MWSRWIGIYKLQSITCILVALVWCQIAFAAPISIQGLSRRTLHGTRNLQRRQERLVVASIDGAPVDIGIVDLIDQYHIAEVAIQSATSGTPEFDSLVQSMETIRLELEDLMNGVATFVTSSPQSTNTDATAAAPAQTDVPQTDSTESPVPPVETGEEATPTIVDDTLATRTEPQSTATATTDSIPSGVPGGDRQESPAGDDEVARGNNGPRSTSASIITSRIPTATGATENAQVTSNGGSQLLRPRYSTPIYGVGIAALFIFVL